MACSPSRDATSTAALGQFIDESGCAHCHVTQHQAWAGSHHDLAMQDASEQTVLADFNSTRFGYAGVTSRFFRRDGKFVVITDGPDGKLADFEIKHTFRVKPLQQYLIELPGGRLQALSIAWDTRRKRWFHLYPGERVDFRDELHWTKPSQNWNHMCGECHATDYRKNYDATTSSYKTTAARFDVGCQACHGPASRHVDWAKRAGEDAAKAARGSRKQDFSVDLGQIPPSESSCIRGFGFGVPIYKKLKYDLGLPITGLHFTTAGASTAYLVISMKKEHDGQPKQAIWAAWAVLPRFAKFTVVVYDDIDVRDALAVEWAMSFRVQPARDIFIEANTLSVPLDPSVPVEGPVSDERRALGSKVGIDATRKQAFSPIAFPPKEHVIEVEKRWKEYGLDRIS